MNQNKNHVRRKQNHRSSSGKRRAKNKSSDGNASTNSSGGEMDDVMAQLQLQRERQKQKKKDGTADVLAAAKVREDTKPKKRDAAPSLKQESGDFRFDPISNRYLPKSSFIKRDRKEAQDQAKNVSIDRLRWGKRYSISDEDVRRVIFRGSALENSRPLPNTSAAQKKKAKKQRGDNESCNEQQYDPQQQIPCSDRIVQLLTTSLQYANSHKRNAIVNILGPIAMARGAKVVPSAVTDDMLCYTKTSKSDQQMQQHTSRKSRDVSSTEPVTQPVPINIQRREKSTKSSTRKSFMGERWHSLLHPIIQSGMSLGTPYDCICKTFLPPTASTFDIQPQRNNPNSIPSVVTIAGDELFCRQKYSIPPGGRRAFQLSNPPDYCSAWNLSVLDHVDTTCQSVKFSPYQIGVLAHDSSFQYCFAFKTFAPNSSSLTHVVPLDDVQVNDFCFSPNGETVCYRPICHLSYAFFSFESPVFLVHDELAFVSGPAESKCGVSYLDITAGREFRFPMRNRSEALSVQYLGDQVLCGHRNGSISIHDGSGPSQVSTAAMSSFGSATSIHPLQDGNSVVVKYSFGSCKFFDVRKFNTNAGSSDKATVMDLVIPSSLVHKTNSTRCTGVALDPTETIVTSPFAGQNNASFALWCLKTGKFLRSIDLGWAGNNTQLPPFCELSSKTTSGFAIRPGWDSTMPLITKESDFGVWFKSEPMNPSTPPNCGGIHHLSFPK